MKGGKFSLQEKISAFFCLAVLGLGFIIYAIAVNNQYSVKTARAVEHVQEVLLHTEELRTGIDEVQSGTRGYIITGEALHLELYERSRDRIHHSVQELTQLTGDNARQHAAIDSLSGLISNITASGARLINIRQTSGSEAAMQVFKNGEDEYLDDRARAAIGSVQQEENRLLTQSRAENLKSIRHSSILISVFILIIILLLMIAFRVISKNTRLRNQAEEKINRMNASLVQTVEEKTGEVIEKEKQYRFLIENMREGIQVIGFDWRYQFVNHSVMEQSRFPKEQLLGSTMMEKHPGITRTELFKVLERCMNERVPATFENEFIYPDGNTSWFDLSIQPVPEGLFVLSTDVTGRKKAEQELTAQTLLQQQLATRITIEAQEKERNELGKELHDNINQILATANIYLSMVKSGVECPDDLVGLSYNCVNQAIDETRKLSHSLVAPSLGENTLHAVLQKLAHEASLVNGLQVVFEDKTGGKTKLDKHQQLMLYRIAQEQITNIRKYSKAKQARLTLQTGSSHIFFSISDNGVGFDPSKKAAGIGLKNIKSRVELYSGTMNIIAAPGNGCTLEVAVPLNLQVHA